MKKAIFTLAVLVMAIGNMGFAQSKANLREMSKQRMLKQLGLVRESYIVPQQANYHEVDGTRHRTTYYYDESELYLTEEIMETYYDYWVNESRGSYEYDFFGNVIEMLVQEWNDDDWEDMMKMSYTYDGDVLSEVIYQFYINGTWLNTAKEVYNFNGDTWTVLYWAWNGTTWASDYLYTYLRSGNTIELLVQYMEGGAWQNEEKQIYTLDFDENITEILVQEWENNTWVNNEKVTYTYENGVYVQQLVQEWDGDAWNDEYKYTFEYDQLGNAKHGDCFWLDGNDWELANGDIEMAYDYNADKKTFYGAQVDMTYVDLTTINENPNVAFTIYPNPAEGEIQIQAEDFQKAEVYSLTGQKMMESLQNTIDVSDLASGVYMLKVFDQTGNSVMQRLVVK